MTTIILPLDTKILCECGKPAIVIYANKFYCSACAQSAIMREKRKFRLDLAAEMNHRTWLIYEHQRRQIQ